MTFIGEISPVWEPKRAGDGNQDLGSQTLLDVKELAEVLQVSERHVRDLARAREIPYYKVGRLYRFDREQVLNHLLVEPVSSVEQPCQKAPKELAQRSSQESGFGRYDRGSRDPFKHYDDYGNLIEDGEE